MLIILIPPRLNWTNPGDLLIFCWPIITSRKWKREREKKKEKNKWVSEKIEEKKWYN